MLVTASKPAISPSWASCGHVNQSRLRLRLPDTSTTMLDLIDEVHFTWFN